MKIAKRIKKNSVKDKQIAIGAATFIYFNLHYLDREIL